MCGDIVIGFAVGDMEADYRGGKVGNIVDIEDELMWIIVGLGKRGGLFFVWNKKFVHCLTPCITSCKTYWVHQER